MEILTFFWQRSGIITTNITATFWQYIAALLLNNVFRMQMRLRHHCQKKDVAAKVLPQHIVTTPLWQYIAAILLLYPFCMQIRLLQYCQKGVTIHSGNGV